MRLKFGFAPRESGWWAFHRSKTTDGARAGWITVAGLTISWFIRGHKS